MFIVAAALVVLLTALAAGMSKGSDRVLATLVGVLALYPALNTTVLPMAQSRLLGFLMVSILGVVAGQRLWSGQQRTGAWAEVGALYAFIAGCTFAIATFSPAVVEIETERWFLLGLVVAVVALALGKPVNMTMLAVVTVGAEIAVLLFVVSGSSESAANAIWVARTVLLAGVILASRVARTALKHAVLGVHLGLLFYLEKQGPVVGLLVAWTCIHWMTSASGRRVLGVLVGSAAALFVLWNPAAERRLIRTVDDLGTASDRVDLISQAVSQWARSPVFGEGLGSYLGIASNQLYTYPHNVWFEILAELGLVGLALFGYAAWRFGRYSAQVGLLPAYLAMLVSAMVSGSLVINHEFWIIGALSTALARCSIKIYPPTARGRSSPGGLPDEANNLYGVRRSWQQAPKGMGADRPSTE